MLPESDSGEVWTKGSIARLRKRWPHLDSAGPGVQFLSACLVKRSLLGGSAKTRERRAHPTPIGRGRVSVIGNQVQVDFARVDPTGLAGGVKPRTRGRTMNVGIGLAGAREFDDLTVVDASEGRVRQRTSKATPPYVKG